MGGSALLALLRLCLGLADTSEKATVTKDFDFSKFAGLWYEVSFAAKAGTCRETPQVEKMRGVVLQLENRSLVLTAAYYEGRCVVEKTTATKSIVPGTFTIIREGVKGVSHHVMKLYSRSLDHNQNALQKFCEAAQERGFQEPDFHLLKHDMACVETLQGGALSF